MRKLGIGMEMKLVLVVGGVERSFVVRSAL